MEREELLVQMREQGAMLEGHFRLSSGLHSHTYLQMARLLMDPQMGETLGLLLGEHFSREEVEVVVGPALGGIIIGYLVGMALKRPAIFSERGKDGKMTLRRGFSIEPGSRVLLVEDVITTGASIQETQDVIVGQGGVVMGMGTIVDRSLKRLPFPITSLIRLPIENFSPENCPLCAEGMALTVPGSRNP